MWAHKEGRQPEHKAIEHGEIRRTLSGAIADQELMFEQERFSYDLARAAQTEEFREGHEQMDRQEEQIAHEYYLAGQSAQDCTTAAIHAKFANSPPTGVNLGLSLCAPTIAAFEGCFGYVYNDDQACCHVSYLAGRLNNANIGLASRSDVDGVSRWRRAD